MLNGQVNKFLIIGVAASHAGFGGNVNQAGVLVKLFEHIAFA